MKKPYYSFGLPLHYSVKYVIIFAVFCLNQQLMSQIKPKVIVAMSGGVDSSVAAYLLLQKGYQVEGLFMKNWEEDDTETYCSATQDISDAEQVCNKLGIKLHKINFAYEYWENVFADFLQEHKKNRTPNPDILCNKEIKFKHCMDYAFDLGADFFATGHYAKIENEQLVVADDLNKDQSYFLYTLKQDKLKKIFFPISDLKKPEVRKIAQSLDLITHNKKDSTGICFIGERKFRDFLNKYIKNNPGDIKDSNGRVIGEHVGLMFYTLGQRQGLNIGGVKNTPDEPWYVYKKEPETNTLYVTQGNDNPLLFGEELIADNLSWVGTPPKNNSNIMAKIRYRQPSQNCNITFLSEDKVHIKFKDKQRAITPGQAIVFYDKNICLGGGTIN